MRCRADPSLRKYGCAQVAQVGAAVLNTSTHWTRVPSRRSTRLELADAVLAVDAVAEARAAEPQTEVERRRRSPRRRRSRPPRAAAVCDGPSVRGTLVVYLGVLDACRQRSVLQRQEWSLDVRPRRGGYRQGHGKADGDPDGHRCAGKDEQDQDVDSGTGRTRTTAHPATRRTGTENAREMRALAMEDEVGHGRPADEGDRRERPPMGAQGELGDQQERPAHLPSPRGR